MSYDIHMQSKYCAITTLRIQQITSWSYLDTILSIFIIISRSSKTNLRDKSQLRETHLITSLRGKQEQIHRTALKTNVNIHRNGLYKTHRQ